MSSITFRELKAMKKGALSSMLNDLTGKRMLGFNDKKSFVIKKLMEHELKTRTCDVSLFHKDDKFIFRNEIENYDVDNESSSSEELQSSSSSPDIYEIDDNTTINFDKIMEVKKVGRTLYDYLR